MLLRLVALALVAVVAALASALVGGTPLSLHDLGYALAHPHVPDAAGTILWQLRFPRIVIACVVGASLSVTGALLQGMLRNPLVDPYLTGVSSGAAAAIALAVLAGISPLFSPFLGFTAGLAVAVLVAALARRGAGIDAMRLILAGISISAVCSAIVTFALTRAQSIDYAQQILAWLAGSMAGHGWHDLAIALPYILLGFAIAAIVVPALNALRIGDVRARAAGVDVDRTQWLILLSSSLLTASSVTLSGTIGFVGLIVPHLSRRVVGSDARVLLPACAFIGAALTCVADAISRSIAAPAEIPIGVLFAVIGVPVFLAIYLRREARS